MKKIILSVFVLAGLMFTSCKDDDNNGTEEETVDVSKMYLPLKMTGDGYTTTFTYNNKAQVTKIVESDGSEYSFTYSGDQLVEFVEKYNTSKTTYTFSQEGNIITLNAVNEYDGETSTNTGTLEVDEKGNLVNDGYFTYIYDTAGNNIKILVDEDSEAILTFDTKNGIFKNLNLPKWVSNWMLSYNTYLVNNALTFSFVSEEDPEDNNSGTMAYEYNTDGYPVKASFSSTDESGTETETVIIEYTKK